MSDPKADRLAAIRAANAQKQAAGAAPAAAPTTRPAAETHRAEGGLSEGDSAAYTAAEGGPAGSAQMAPATSQTTRLADAPARPASQTARLADAPARPAPQTARLADTPVRVAAAQPGNASAVQPLPEPALGFPQIGLLLLAVAGGAFVATFALPAWLPGLSASLLGPEPKAYWYLARSTAFVAYGLLWLSMALGLTMTNKLARLWPGGPVAFDLHEHASILGLAFGLFHALILLGDSYSSYTLAQILTPFASDYEPFWIGLGQISLYLMGIVGLSFYVRPLIGRQGWRLIHFLSFVIFGLVLLHGVLSGSDSGTAWAQAIYWLSGGSLLFLTIYRVLVSAIKPTPAAPAAPTKPTSRERLVETQR